MDLDLRKGDMMNRHLVLFVMIILLSSAASAKSTYLVAHDDGPSSDVLKLNSVATLLVTEGYDSEVRLNSEVEKEDYEGRITVFMYYGNTLIVHPLGQGYLVDLISTHLEDNYGIVAEVEEADEVRHDDLTKEIVECDDCPEPEYTIEQAFVEFDGSEETRDILIIRDDEDGSADEAIRRGRILKVTAEHRSKSPVEVVVSDLIEKNLIILGGPCANAYWTRYATETCDTWPLQEGQGMIKSVWQGDRNIILIAGTLKEDTESLSAMFGSASLYDKLKGETEVVLTV